MTLEELGFDDWFRDQAAPGDGLAALRVTAVHKGECEVSDGGETFPAKMTGQLRHRARSRLDYPTVGDWVWVKEDGQADFGRIHAVLRRRNALRRKTAGRTVRYQLIAANIDTAFIMQALGPGYNLQRLERYLVMVNESGVDPVILLGKRDLLSAPELERLLDELRERIPDTPVFPFSNIDRQGLDEVAELFRPRKTYCVIGPSGVGKTSLLNNLVGEDRFFTLPVREKDGKGLHSTTWRELVALDNGALLIDTPGMRELGHLDAYAGIAETFDDIAALAAQCRFRDCSHVGILGCAVIAAVERGEIPRARYENFVRLMEESALRERQKIAKRDQDRKLGRFYRSVQNARRKGKEEK